MKNPYQQPEKKSRRRAAFTLVELMIAVAVLLILSVVTISAVNITQEGDRVPGGARAIQSYLEGARDRARFSTKTDSPGPRGVRFLRDPNNENAVIQMVFIGPPKTFAEGNIRIGRVDSAGNVLDRRTVQPVDPDVTGVLPQNASWRQTSVFWRNLFNRRFLANGARIEIPRGSGIFYTIIRNAAVDRWELTKDFPASQFPTTQDYELELDPAILPNQEPRLLPRNVAIDMTAPVDANGDGLIGPGEMHSRIPLFWTGVFRNRMDILFTPRGNVTGRAAAVGGYLHLVVSDIGDIEQGFGVGDPAKEFDERIVSINTRTGSVSVHEVNPSYDPTTGNQIPSLDPFFFAETGKESE